MLPSFADRLEALRFEGKIGGYAVPHKNQGRGEDMLPWVIIAKDENRGSTMYYNDTELESALSILERFGPDALDTHHRTVVVER